MKPAALGLSIGTTAIRAKSERAWSSGPPPGTRPAASGRSPRSPAARGAHAQRSKGRSPFIDHAVEYHHRNRAAKLASFPTNPKKRAMGSVSSVGAYTSVELSLRAKTRSVRAPTHRGNPRQIITGAL